VTEQEWREQLKAGDEVVIRGIGFGNRMELSSVIRTTKAQVLVKRGSGESLYRKKDGYLVSTDRWSKSSIVQPTQAMREAISLAALHSKALMMKEALNVPKDRAGLEAFIAAITAFMPRTS
jgi:hypothetical protein